MHQFARTPNAYGQKDSREGIDRMCQFLRGPWVAGTSCVALDGRGLVLALALAVVSLLGFGFSFF